VNSPILMYGTWFQINMATYTQLQVTMASSIKSRIKVFPRSSLILRFQIYLILLLIMTIIFMPPANRRVSYIR